MNQFEIAIKAHLDTVALSDAVFAEKYITKCKNEEESISKCCNYIISCVEKMKRTAMTDAEVFGMAIHYYDENVSFEGSASKCNVVVSADHLSEEEKARIRQKAQEELEKEAIEIEKQRLLAEAKKQEELHRKRVAEAEKKKQELIEKQKNEFKNGGLLFEFDE